MSLKATLSILVFALCTAVISLAGLHLQNAWSNRNMADQTLSAVPRSLEIKTVTDALATEQLRLYALAVSIGQVDGAERESILSSFAETDALIARLLQNQDPGLRARASQALGPYQEMRLTTLDAAQRSAMVRDMSTPTNWLTLSRQFASIFSQEALTTGQGYSAFSRLLKEIVEMETALVDDVTVLVAPLASRRAFGTDTVAALARNEARFALSEARIEDITANVLPGLAAPASALLANLEETYEARRSEVLDAGINGKAFPAHARSEAWFEIASTTLTALQTFRGETLRYMLQVEQAGMEQARQNLLVSGAVIALTLLGTITAIWLVIFKIVRPIRKSVGVVEELAKGNINFSLAGFSRRHELGALTHAIHSLRDSEREERAKRAARFTANEKLIAEVDQIVSAAAKGDFSRTIKLEDPALDEGAEALMDGVTRLCEIVTGFAQDVEDAVDALSQGDLTYRPNQSYEGLFGDVTRGVSNSMMRVGSIVGDVQAAAGQIDRAVEDISTRAAGGAARASQQAVLVEESRNTLAELTDNISQNSDAAQDAATAGQTVLDHTNASVDMIDHTAATMGRVEQSSKDISDIVTMIEEIAFQTNILALNASVEAARAGNSGSGFAVVAQEVRALAKRVSDAAMNIGELISTSVGQVQDAAGSVRETNVKLRQMQNEITDVVQAVHSIAAICQEQSAGAASVAARFEEFNETTQAARRVADHNQATAEELARSTQQMMSQVAFFRTEAIITPEEDAA